MAHLSSSAIFSPSVARQQLAAAKDWNYIDNWLSTKFNGKTPPPFERNNDTLKALLALAALNESADEECELLARVEAKALHDLKTKEDANLNTQQLLGSMGELLNREGQLSLEALSTLGVALNQPFPDMEKLGRRIVDLQVTSYDIDQANDRISILERHLQQELEHINTLITELQSDDYQPLYDSTKQTMDLQRKAKVLAAKLPELKDRIASLSINDGTEMGTLKITAHNVKAEEDLFRELMTMVRDLELQVKSYHGLPQDTDLARLELERVRVDLRDLTHRRDSMFEGLVERESPSKPRT